ncbi:hypothetical protein B296_00043309 [Ensete ventricosum]|uniref:Uncharacterized protein n=1 Tax=Ensete ventricosum TaxID=4639 RepID=A0A426Y499_ENSVE|nr:hypothetical protein B296_00043309 [Ensete ventricosum]
MEPCVTHIDVKSQIMLSRHAAFMRVLASNARHSDDLLPPDVGVGEKDRENNTRVRVHDWLEAKPQTKSSIAPSASRWGPPGDQK